jgi:hypothetical protein
MKNIKPLLQDLDEFLKKSNAKAQDSFARLKPMLALTKKVRISKELQHIQEHIDRFAFKKAHASLKRLAGTLEVALDGGEK